MQPRLLSILVLLPALLLAALPARAVGLRDVIDALESPFQQRRIKDYSADFFQESRIASLDRLQRARGRVSVRFDSNRQRNDRVPLVMFHWEYEEPTRQEIISDGKTLWVYLPENNQVIQSDIEMVSQARENDPMTFLTGLGNLSRDFLISWAEPNRDPKGNYVLALRPRRTTALIGSMIIVVDRDAVEVPATLTGREEAGTAADRARLESRRSESRQERPSETPTPDEFFGKNTGDSRTYPSRGGLIFPILATTVTDPNGNSTTIEFSDVRVNRNIPAGQFRFTLPPGVEVVRPTGKEMGF